MSQKEGASSNPSGFSQAPSADNRHARSRHASELWPLARDRELLILLFLRSRWDYPSAVFQSK